MAESYFWLKGLSDHFGLINLNADIKNDLRNVISGSNVKQQLEAIAAFPIADRVLCLVEKETYVFDIENILEQQKELTLKTLSVGSSSKQIEVVFEDGKTEWDGKGSQPNKIKITTDKLCSFGYIYILASVDLRNEHI
jgi:hypothetical protein